MDKEDIKLKGTYYFKIISADGMVKREFSIDNIVVSTGKAQLAALAGSVVTPFTYIAVGTSNTAVSAGQTALIAEISTNGLSRTTGTFSQVTTTTTNDTMQLTKTYSVSGTSTIEEIGIFNAASVGVMLSRALTGSTSVVNGDQLILIYRLVIS